MRIKSVAQKDIYEFEQSDLHIKVTKSDGKVWYLPIEDVNKISSILQAQRQIEYAKSEIEKLTV